MTTPDPDWTALCGSLPAHQDEMTSSHEGRPTIDVQSATHGAGRPAEDRGVTEDQKYGGNLS